MHNKDNEQHQKLLFLKIATFQIGNYKYEYR
jgi:hypothetical protein